jgi:biotin operon repressor
MQQPLALNIVTSLRQYHSMPVDFIAKLTGRSREDVLKYVTILKEKGVVDVDGDKVSLISEDN